MFRRLVVMVIALTAMAGLAATVADPAVAAEHTWTIRYRDSGGHIVKTVQVSKSDHDRLRAAGISPQFVQVHCGAPNDFVIHKDHPKAPFCYSGSGSAYINVPFVYEIDSGKWTGHYIADGGSYWLPPFTTDLWASFVTVTYLGLA